LTKSSWNKTTILKMQGRIRSNLTNFFRNKSTSYDNNNDDDWLITFNDDDRWFLDTIVTFFNIEEMSKNQKQYFSMIFMKNFILFFIGKKRKTLTNECNI